MREQKTKNHAVRERGRAKDKVEGKLPFRDYARLTVLKEGFRNHQIPMNRVVDLSHLRIGGKLFSDLISSRPAIGPTTKAGLAEIGIKVVPVRATKTGRIEVAKFEKAGR